MTTSLHLLKMWEMTACNNFYYSFDVIAVELSFHFVDNMHFILQPNQVRSSKVFYFQQRAFTHYATLVPCNRNTMLLFIFVLFYMLLNGFCFVFIIIFGTYPGFHFLGDSFDSKKTSKGRLMFYFESENWFIILLRAF